MFNCRIEFFMTFGSYKDTTVEDSGAKVIFLSSFILSTYKEAGKLLLFSITILFVPAWHPVKMIAAEINKTILFTLFSPVSIILNGEPC